MCDKRIFSRFIGVLLLLLPLGCSPLRPSAETATPENVGDLARARMADRDFLGVPLEPVALISGQMPTGIAISRSGRIFLSFPRWGDPVATTLAELKEGEIRPYPGTEMNEGTIKDFQNKFVSVQSVVMDGLDRLWVLDTGSVNFGPTPPGAAKLVGFDLKTDTIFKIITFPTEVVLPTTYLNDVRFDLRHGSEGTAFISDSSDKGPNGIIVVDLASGRSWRRLHNHPSTQAERNFSPLVERTTLMVRPKPGASEPLRIGIDGIALDVPSKTLFYTALAGRTLYRVSTEALANPAATEADVAATVENLGVREFASDGLEASASGTLFLTDYENNGLERRTRDGTYTTLVSDSRLLWPDSLALGTDGYLYGTANQLHRQPRFQEGKDLREPPYLVFRIKTGETPIQYFKF